MGFDTETLEKLLVLQEVDRVIFSLKERKKQVPGLIEKLNNEIKEKEEQIKKEEEEIEIIEKEIKSLNFDLEEIEQNIKKFSEDLMKVKTNEEYRACLQEIEFAKKRKEEIEEEILERMEKIEEKKERFKIEKEKILSEINDKKKKIEELEREFRELPLKIEEAEDLRKRRRMVIDERVLDEYELILNGKGFPVICEIEVVSYGKDKNFYCSGCGSQVPFLTVDGIIKTRETSRCHNCGRIIYLKDLP